MNYFTRTCFRTLAAGLTIAGLAAVPAGAQDGDSQEYTGTLAPLNDSGASGTVTMTVDGTTVDITVTISGVVDLVHAQHLHGEFGASNSCPSGDEYDTDGDGLVNTVEGVPNYGTVKVSLTTEGDTSGAYALAIESFPVADGGGYTYTRSFEVDEETAANISDLVYVVHGIDFDDSGAYDGDAPSSLDPELPLEATVPAGCATLVASAATPVGGVAAGAGGTADTGGMSSTAIVGLALVLTSGGAVLVTRQRRSLR